MIRAVLLVCTVALAAAAAAQARDPAQHHTAADMKRAKALALRRSDLAAGWTTEKPSKPTPPCTAGPDESKLVQTARVDPSFTWKDGITSVGSEIDIFRSAREARLDWKYSTIGLMSTCLLQSAHATLAKSVHMTLKSAKRLPPPKGVERGLHYRFVFTLHSKQTVELVADVVAIGRGRISSVLHTLTVRAPLPPVVVNSLVGVLAHRLGTTSPSGPTA
jgi:hypothetical protein